MWRRRMTQYSLVTTGLTITSQYCGKTWKSRSNRSMSLKGEKDSMVVLWVEGSYLLHHERGSSQVVGAATMRS